MSAKTCLGPVSRMALGDKEIGKAYLGEVLVFDKRPAPYLEIAPELIWVYPDWSAYNDVYSNTTWNVQ